MNRILLTLAVVTLSAGTTLLAQNIGKPTPPPPLKNPAERTATTAPAYVPRPGEIVLTFPNADVGHPVDKITEKGVTFALAPVARQSRSAPRVMFFPHLETENNGILNAMAMEQAIPVKITFPAEVSEVTLVCWGTGSGQALVEAHDKDGKLIDSASLARLPERKTPADPIPSFNLTVKGEHIAYVLFGGARNGEYIAAEEVRYTPASPAPAK